MPDPCGYDDKDDFVSACVSARQHENPDEDVDQSVAACINIWNDRECGKNMSDINYIYKAGLQSEADPYEFVMSSAAVDRYGDVVEQDWDLKHFKRNAIALWNHNSNTPIGLWEKVRVEGGKLVGRLKLANTGTSELIDTLRNLVEQRILKAVSVGFRPGGAEPLDKDDPWGGYHLTENELLECSLVSVPANPEAVSVAKALHTDRLPGGLFTEKGAMVPERMPAAAQLGLDGSRGSDNDNPSDSLRPKRKQTMSLNEKIAAKLQALAGMQTQLKALTDGEALDADGIDAEVTHQIEELSGQIGVIQADLEPMQRAEKALAKMVVPRETEPEVPESRAASGQPDTAENAARRILLRENKPKGFRAIATVSCLLKAHINRTNAVEVAKSAFRDNPELETLIRAATDPATMGDAAWAGPLVQDTWSAFLELVRDVAIYPNLPGLHLEFDRYGRIVVPRNEGRGALAGGFVQEGKPIPVKEGIYGSTDLSPKKMAVISSFTKDVAEHSMPAIQALVQNQMIEDTAELLDTLYLDANARSAIRPAGLQDTTETGAGNINASTGNTVAAVLADTKAAIGRLLAARAGGSAVWIMNPLRILGLRDMQDAASGAFVFRAELDAGTFRGYPVLSSQNVTVDVVTLQGSSAMAFGNDYAPRIEISDETVLVYDDTAPDDVLPDTNIQPAKSMFQIDAIACKVKQGLDWRQVRADAIQVLTSVDW